ncbi:MAG: hypothetical protein ABSC48_17980 [Terracidiphilus sp.]|jgi:hypothetical protein
MKIMMRSIAGLIATAALMPGCVLAQDSAKEMHAMDFTATQTNDWILNSPLCKSAKEIPANKLEVNPMTLENNLTSLMKKSDEVVLVRESYRPIMAISPTGEYVIQYRDTIVLRTWKGSHNVGDILTYAIPEGYLQCGTTQADNPLGRPIFITYYADGGVGGPYGISILFLRHSKGYEKQLIPDFRLTGGNGIQGVFSAFYDQPCNQVLGGGTSSVSIKKCNDFLDSSQTPILYNSHYNPQLEKVDKMSISDFLQNVQATADSLGYTPQTESGK